MVQNILFDLDETLLDFKRSESRALSNMLRHIGVEPTEKVISRYSEINKSRWKLLEQGLLTRQQVKESRYEILFAELGVEYSAAEATAYYEDQLSQKGFVFPDTIKLLDILDSIRAGDVRRHHAEKLLERIDIVPSDPSILSWNHVEPLSATQAYVIDYDTLVEPYSRTMNRYLRAHGFKIIHTDTCWQVEQFSHLSLLQKLIFVHAKFRIYPYTYWGPHLFVIAQKI